MLVRGHAARDDDDDDDDPSPDTFRPKGVPVDVEPLFVAPSTNGFGQFSRRRERRPLLTYDAVLPSRAASRVTSATSTPVRRAFDAPGAPTKEPPTKEPPRIPKSRTVFEEGADEDAEWGRRWVPSRSTVAVASSGGYVFARVLMRTAGVTLKVVKMLWVWLAVGLALLALSFLFELLYPWNAEPEVLTQHAVDMLTIVQQWTDFLLGAARVFFSILRPFIPMWNSWSNYVVQPIIFIALEIVSMLIPPFFHHDVFFVMPGDPEYFKGFSCIGSEAARAALAAKALADGVLLKSDPDAAYTSMAWCGIEGWYKGGVTAMGSVRRLTAEITERNGGWPPRSFEDAAALHAAAGGRVVLPLDVVDRVTRRLQEVEENWIDTEGRMLELIIAVLGTEVRQLVYVVSVIVGLFIYLLGAVADMFFHVIYVLLDDVVYAFGEIVVTALQVAIKLLMSLVSSGALATILSIALDVIVIGVMDIAIPMMFVTIDSIMCAFHLFDVASWPDELRCIDRHCFQPGAGGASDLVVFTSIWIVLDEVFKVVQDTFSAGARLFDLGTANISSAKFWARAESAATNGTAGCAAYAHFLSTHTYIHTHTHTHTHIHTYTHTYTHNRYCPYSHATLAP